MMRLIFVVVLSILSFGSLAGQDCNPVELSDGLSLDGPTGATEVLLVDPQDGSKHKVADAASGQWTVREVELTALRDWAPMRNLAQRKRLVMTFAVNGTPVGPQAPFLLAGEHRALVCGTAVAQPEQPAQPASPTVQPPQPPQQVSARRPGLAAMAPDVFVGGVSDLEACQLLAPPEIDALNTDAKTRDGRGFTALFFTTTGQLCFTNRDYGVFGDPIHVFLLNDQKLAAPSAQFAPCALEPAGISMYVPGQFPTVPQSESGAARVPYTWLRLPPRRCFNTSVDVTVTARHQTVVNGTTTGETITGRHSLMQYERYRSTLQVGVAFTDLHDQAYDLRADGTNMRIYNKGPVETGPEYFASVVLYSLPRYAQELFGRRRGGSHFYGRDIVNDQGPLDRIGGVLGASISDPGKRFVSGLSFEVARGVNLVALVEFAQADKLVGLKEGDVFTGTAEQIPVQATWQRDFVAGLSLDFRYITALFSRQ